jgi:hypothetical protein
MECNPDVGPGSTRPDRTNSAAPWRSAHLQAWPNRRQGGAPPAQIQASRGTASLRVSTRTKHPGHTHRMAKGSHHLPHTAIGSHFWAYAAI